MNKNNNKISGMLRLYLFITMIAASILYLSVNSYIASSQKTDFCQDYESAKLLVQNKSPYQGLNCWSFIPPFDVTYNPHPPLSLILFIPLLLFPLPVAGFTWSVFSLILYLLACILLLDILQKLTLENVALVFFASILWEPVRAATLHQNIIQLLFFILVIAWYAEIKKKRRIAGILVGLATLLRYWPALYLLPSIIARKKETAITALTTIIIGSALTLIIIDWGHLLSYLGPVQKAENLYVLHVGNISLVSVTAKMLYVAGANTDQAILGAKIFSVILFGAISLIFLPVVNKIKQDERIYTLSKSIFLTLLIFVFPVVWEWGLLMYILIFAMVFHALKTIPKPSMAWLSVLRGSIIILFPLHAVIKLFLPENINSLRIGYLNYLVINNLTLLIGITLLLIFQIRLLMGLKDRTA